MDWHGNRGESSPKSGVVVSMQCGICSTEMTVTRNVMGPTSYAEAMGRGKHLHDSFRCPHYDEPWHERIGELMDEGVATKSSRIQKTLQREISRILRNKKI